MYLLAAILGAVGWVVIGWTFGHALKNAVGADWAVIILVPLFVILHLWPKKRV